MSPHVLRGGRGTDREDSQIAPGSISSWPYRQHWGKWLQVIDTFMDNNDAQLTAFWGCLAPKWETTLSLIELNVVA